MAMNYFKRFLLLGLCLLLFSCNFNKSKEKTGFSLNQYFDNEIKQLNSKNLKLNKTIVQGDSVFSTEIIKPEWAKELAIFKQYADIKFQQLKNYEIDTFKMDNGNYFITYRAIQIKQELKVLEMQYNSSNSIEKITLIVQNIKTLNNHDINLTYLPQKGYDIKGEINSKLSANMPLDIHGEIVENIRLLE